MPIRIFSAEMALFDCVGAPRQLIATVRSTEALFTRFLGSRGVNIRVLFGNFPCDLGLPSFRISKKYVAIYKYRPLIRIVGTRVASQHTSQG